MWLGRNAPSSHCTRAHRRVSMAAAAANGGGDGGGGGGGSGSGVAAL